MVFRNVIPERKSYGMIERSSKTCLRADTHRQAYLAQSKLCYSNAMMGFWSSFPKYKNFNMVTAPFRVRENMLAG